MATPVGKFVAKNWMTGTEEQYQISLTTNEIRGSMKYSIGIANPFSTDKANWMDSTI